LAALLFPITMNILRARRERRRRETGETSSGPDILDLE
jgi:hypothetical protein